MRFALRNIIGLVLERARREPVVVGNVAEALLIAGVAFGLDLSGDQVAALVGVVLALQTLLVRARVSPTAPDIGVAIAYERDADGNAVQVEPGERIPE